jgi:D-alanyl-lipoteichoic acid acyltransferase DltB (MBOAT superfamily)
MIFNSLEFAIFLPLVFILYWFLFKNKLRAQNFLIVAASYVFYGWWDWRFLSLIIFSTLIDYFIGIFLEKEERLSYRKLLLWSSIFVNLGFLGFFKYYNFFVDSFVDAFSFFGYKFGSSSLNILLPVGISFYTFQTLSYTIDLYKKSLKPTKDFISFVAFVSFFPQLVAGPIERATNLLPQFHKKRIFKYETASDGMRQILWGLFKKIVIADNCAIFANQIFDNYQDYSGSTLLLGSVFFALQIYGDFSGYSDIAIGTSRLFGFNLKQNFAFPYFSRDIAEFWRRWHMSLSTWFRDYLYIPLGGSRGGIWSKIKNTFIIFIVSGLWHGANWTFVFWGFLNACYFLPLMILNKNRRHTDTVAEDVLLPSFKEFLGMSFTFFITCIAWVFFRSVSIDVAFDYLKRTFNESLFSIPSVLPRILFMIIGFFIIVEWLQRNKQHGLELTQNVTEDEKDKFCFLRWAFYVTLVLMIYFLGNFAGDIEFIYFQF